MTFFLYLFMGILMRVWWKSLIFICQRLLLLYLGRVFHLMWGAMIVLAIDRSMAVRFLLAVLCLVVLLSFKSIKFGSFKNFSTILSLLLIYEDPHCGLRLLKSQTMIKGLDNWDRISVRSCKLNVILSGRKYCTHIFRHVS